MDSGAWDERYAAADLVWSAEPNQFVARVCADLEPGRAVDLAAGEGRNAIWLAREGWQVTAVDFSQVGLDKGAEVAGDLAVEWVRADATTWQGHDYDLALLAYLQLPADQRRAAVRAAWSALRVGGTLLVVAHDSSNLEHGVGGPQDPQVLYTAQDVLDDLEGEPLEVVEAGCVDRVVGGGDASSHRHGGAGVARDALVVARRV